MQDYLKRDVVVKKYMVTMNFLIDTKITSNQNKNYAVTQKNIT